MNKMKMRMTLNYYNCIKRDKFPSCVGISPES